MNGYMKKQDALGNRYTVLPAHYIDVFGQNVVVTIYIYTYTLLMYKYYIIYMYKWIEINNVASFYLQCYAVGNV